VRPRERGRARELDARLRSFSKKIRPLPGIEASSNREAFVEQIIESIRRITYISVIRERDLSKLREDPSTDFFDPLKAAVLRQREGRIEEAFWLVFLSVHFGRNRHTGWRLARDVYGALGSSTPWDWARINSSPKRFCRWLAAQQAILKGGDGILRRFGNHRKYESLNAASPKWTGVAIESYVRWVGPSKSHQDLVQRALEQVGGDPRETFDYLYRSMSGVARFGRTARFDYLTMVGKLGLAPIEPGSTYMEGATGPRKGALLLFGGNMRSKLSPSELEAWLVQLEAHLELYFGMQVLEDALCNWQKSPGKFKPFRG
jgi:hypothetical protein